MKIKGSNQNNALTGTDGDDLIRGRAGDDVLLGEGGNDILRGGLGSDTLWGGDGLNKMWGGAGADAFCFSPYVEQGKPDRVKDFVSGEDVVIFRTVRGENSANLSASYHDKTGKLIIHQGDESHVVAKFGKGTHVEDDDILII